MSQAEEIITGKDGLQWQPVESRCPICNDANYRFKGFRGGEYHRDAKGVKTTIVRCKTCGLLYTNPTLMPLGNPYDNDEEYFEAHDAKRKHNYGQELAAKAESLIGRKGRLIEPACGLGDFLIGAKNGGWEVRGIEMTQSYADRARANGLDIEVAPVDKSEYLKEQYDAMFLLAMLEHLYEPLKMMELAYDALKPGGVIVINVPNELSSMVSRVGNIYIKSYGKDWTMSLSPTFSPFHVVGFSPKTLRYALEKVGFEVISVETQSGYNVLPVGGLRQKLEHAGLTLSLLLGKVSDHIGMGNELLCWARKPRPLDRLF